MKILASLFIALSLISPQRTWSSETPFRLPNAQEISAARAGEADFEASPWTDLKQAIEQHQEKAFFFALDLYASLSHEERKQPVGIFFEDVLKIVRGTVWKIFFNDEIEKLRLTLRWLKLRMLEPGNSPSWLRLSQPRFAIRILNIGDIDLTRVNEFIQLYCSAVPGIPTKLFQPHQGPEFFDFLQDMLQKFLDARTFNIPYGEHLRSVILLYSFLPKGKRTSYLKGIVQEIQKENGKVFLELSILLKEWPDTDIPEYRSWVEMLRDQTKNEADRAWATQRLKELECSAEVTSEAPKTGEANQ